MDYEVFGKRLRRDENMSLKDTISDSMIHSLYERKSVRVFTGEHIPEDDVRIIAEAAAQSPTAGNQQLYTILRITDPEKKHKLSGRFSACLPMFFLLLC
jgi:hypothetical protein